MFLSVLERGLVIALKGFQLQLVFVLHALHSVHAAVLQLLQVILIFLIGNGTGIVTVVLSLQDVTLLLGNGRLAKIGAFELHLLDLLQVGFLRCYLLISLGHLQVGHNSVELLLRYLFVGQLLLVDSDAFLVEILLLIEFLLPCLFQRLHALTVLGC